MGEVLYGLCFQVTENTVMMNTVTEMKALGSPWKRIRSAAHHVATVLSIALSHVGKHINSTVLHT